MKSESENPLLPAYEHLLAEGGRYPAKYVDIFWNKAQDGEGRYRVFDVEAVFVPRLPLQGPLKNDDLRKRYGQYSRRWRSDLGNSCAGWMEPGGMAPAYIFGQLLRAGFRDEAEMISAVGEFAHIEECDWAREMLRALEPERG